MAKRKIKWKIVPRPASKGGGWAGVIVLPTGKLTTKVIAKGKTDREAMKNAAGLAEQLLDNPILAAALPPGTAQAVKATKLIAKYAKAGKVADALEKLTGKGAKRVKKVLKKLKFW